MSEELLKNLRTDLDKIINFVKNEFSALHTNRPTPALVRSQRRTIWPDATVKICGHHKCSFT